MDYIAFCKNYYASTYIPISLTDGCEILYSTLVDLFHIPPAPISAAPSDLINCPQFSCYHPELEYGIVQLKGTKLAFTIGPVIGTEITPAIVNLFLRENLIPIQYKEQVHEFLCTIPRISHLQLAKHMTLLHQIMNDEEVELSHFFPDNASPDSAEHAAEVRFEDEHKHEYYDTYANEIQLYEIIKSGNETRLREFLSKTPLNLLSKPLSNSPIRNAKNMFINTITNVVMIGGIPGGIPMAEAFDRMGEYVRTCENLHSLEEIETLRYNMLLTFCRLSNRRKAAEDISSDLFSCLSYIRTHTNENLTVDDVAAYIDRSPSYVTKCFRKELDITPGAFIARCKLEEARSLLVYSEKTLAEISTYLCYSSQSYFQNVFKKKYGMTPAQYRKKMRNVN
ncbi:MAG: AraC family transcriptional regulator [Eubacteriales bacterium]|nr:AraC family transcriptional regulator [Eubacteriales bacterium]